MEESVISWFILCAGFFAGAFLLVRAALAELEERKNEQN